MEGTIRRNTKVIERICLRSKAGSRVGWARLYLFFIISPLFIFIFLDMCIFHFDKHKILSIKNSTLSSLPESVPDSSRVVNVKQWEWGMNSGKPRVWSPIGCLQSHSLGKILARIGTIKNKTNKTVNQYMDSGESFLTPLEHFLEPWSTVECIISEHWQWIPVLG